MFSGSNTTATRQLIATAAAFAGGVVVHELGHFAVAAMQHLDPSVGLSRTGVHVRHSPGTAQQDALVAAAGPIAHAATTVLTTGRRHGGTQGLLNGAVVLTRQFAPVRGADGERLFGRRHEGLRAATYLVLSVAGLGRALLLADSWAAVGLVCHMDASIPLVRRALSDIYFRLRLERLARSGDDRF